MSMLRHSVKYFKEFLTVLGLLIIVSCGSTSDVSGLPNNHLEVGSVANNPGEPTARLTINNFIPEYLDFMLSIWPDSINKDERTSIRDPLLAMIAGTQRIIQHQMRTMVIPGRAMADAINEKGGLDSLVIDGKISMEVETAIGIDRKPTSVVFDLIQDSSNNSYWNVHFTEKNDTENQSSQYVLKPEIVNETTIVPMRGAMATINLNDKSSDTHQVLRSVSFENGLYDTFYLTVQTLIFDGTDYAARLFMLQCHIVEGGSCLAEFQTKEIGNNHQPEYNVYRYAWKKNSPTLCLAIVTYPGGMVNSPRTYSMSDMTPSPESCTIDETPRWANTSFNPESLYTESTISIFSEKMSLITPKLIDDWLEGDFSFFSEPE